MPRAQHPTSETPGERFRFESRLCAELVPHPQANELPPVDENERAALRADIARHGVRSPLKVTADGVVLDGHLRLAAAVELSLAELPVLVVDPADELEYMLGL